MHDVCTCCGSVEQCEITLGNACRVVSEYQLMGECLAAFLKALEDGGVEPDAALYLAAQLQIMLFDDEGDADGADQVG